MSQISCMSFNVLSCVYDPNWMLPQDRFPLVMNTIKAEMPDLVGVQEACNLSCKEPETKACKGFDWCKPLTEAMEELGYEHSILRDQEGFLLERQTIACGLIIFYKKDRFVLNESGCYGYPHDKGRYFQWVKLTDTKFNRNVLFTNTHFSIDITVAGVRYNQVAGNAYRTAEAAMLLNFWHKNCDENTALFATGDYNSVPHSAAQELLRYGVFRPSYMVAEEACERGTCHVSKTAHVIDYCYVNPSAQTVKKYYPVTTRFETEFTCKYQGYPSDHRAIMTFCDYKPIKEEN